MSHQQSANSNLSSEAHRAKGDPQTGGPISAIVANRLCIGCGACAPACPQKAITLFDFLNEGIRPVVDAAADCAGCQACLDVCPGNAVDFRLGVTNEGPYGKDAIAHWGPMLEIWEGHASDPAIRFKSSSGGALTALALYCIERGGMHGVLHTGQDPDRPARNRTRLSRTREQVIAASGSRYAPASVCDGLGLIENAPAPCAFIGKPSEIAALRKSQARNPQLDAKIGIAMTFFCAETPPTAATLSLMAKLGAPDEAQLANLTYRGDGWPGHFAPTCKGETEPRGKQTYQESWAYLQSFRPWSTHIWPDGGGELADISCGDPWYEQPDGKNPGSSLVVVRTERGRALLKAAIEAGYLTLTPAELWKLDKSQDNLLKKKGATWGRIQSMKLAGMKTPDFQNTSLFACWRRLPLSEKLGSTLGTLKRIKKKGLKKPFSPSTQGCSPVPVPIALQRT